MATATNAPKKPKKTITPKAIQTENLLIIGKDGKVVVATSTGKLTVITNKDLAAKLSKLMAERQRAGMDLTEILKEEGFDVVAGMPTGIYPK